MNRLNLEFIKYSDSAIQPSLVGNTVIWGIYKLLPFLLRATERWGASSAAFGERLAFSIGLPLRRRTWERDIRKRRGLLTSIQHPRAVVVLLDGKCCIPIRKNDIGSLKSGV